MIRTFLLGGAVAASAWLSSAATAADMRAFTAECETALALSAAPLHLRDEAGVYLLGKEGYEQTRDSRNGFSCLVERNHADAVIPQCFDKASEHANLAAILDAGKYWRSGMSFAEAEALRQSALERGAYPSAGHGLAYMISDFNYIYNPDAGVMLDVGPHLMFHAPNLSAADIGADPGAARAHPGLPILNAEGPHGFMVSFIDRPSDSSAVLAACRGQLPAKADMQPFPPPG